IILADRNMPEQLRAITGIQKHGNASQPQHSGDRWLITGQNIPFTGWNIYYAAEKQVISAPFTRIKQLFNLGIAIIVFLFIWYSLLFFHNMVTPVNALISKMHLVKNGDYTVAAEATGPEEIQNLVLSFNTMIAEVKQLTEERETNEKERSRLEQEALQYQINPHFIANTLNSIRLMAIMNKDDHIKDMTASLMRLINDSFRSNGSCIRLDEELQNITGYIHIMKVRFGNRIELIDHTPANLADRQLLKMLIQPIVENSIVHGFSEMKGRCTIEISAELKQIADEEQPGKLLITIRDNGKGCSIDPNSPFPSSQSRNARGFTSLGLQNVHKRIILHYGNEFGLTMNSTIGKETSVIIALPNLTALEAPDV
ncbi:MAG: histidine kinase, partial [Spirochaetia bacterium]|nr:histidine kinase [Spirochaetia bacterium]